MTHILMRVKFSPRIDVPGQSEYQNLKIFIGVGVLKVEALFLKTTVPRKYELILDDLYMAFLAGVSGWSYDAVGMIFLEIAKTPVPYFWENIYRDIYYEPPNQYFWWDMHERYKDNVADAIMLLDQREWERDEIEDQKEAVETKMFKDNREKLQRLKD